MKVVILDPDENGVAQMARALEGEQGLASISVVSHGDEGMLLLGNGPLFGGNLQEYQAELQAIGAALGPDGDLLLYGCDVGAGEAGAQFLQSLAQITGADVAASDDSTAGAVRGGDWDLEITTGQIDAAPVLDAQGLQGYDASLHTVGVSTVQQLKDAIAVGSADGQNDFITLTGGITYTAAEDAIRIDVTDGHTLTIVGGGHTLSAGYLARVLDVGATSGNSAVVIQNLVITQGLVAGVGGNGGGAAGGAMGGGIYNAGKLTLDGVMVTHNAASGGGGGGGVAGANVGGGGGGGGGIGRGTEAMVARRAMEPGFMPVPPAPPTQAAMAAATMPTTWAGGAAAAPAAPAVQVPAATAMAVPVARPTTAAFPLAAAEVVQVGTMSAAQADRPAAASITPAPAASP